MVRRRRPLLPEERDRRTLRQTTTGRGQANARPVAVSPTRTKSLRVSSSGFLYDPTNYYFSRWDGTLNAFESARTDLLTPFTTDGSLGDHLQITSGYISPTVNGLYFTSWQLTVSGTGSPVTTMSFVPTTSTSLYFTPTGETAITLSAPTTLPLQAGSVIRANVTNLGPDDGMDYAVWVWVYPLFVA